MEKRLVRVLANRAAAAFKTRRGLSMDSVDAFSRGLNVGAAQAYIEAAKEIVFYAKLRAAKVGGL